MGLSKVLLLEADYVRYVVSPWYACVWFLALCLWQCGQRFSWTYPGE